MSKRNYVFITFSCIYILASLLALIGLCIDYSVEILIFLGIPAISMLIGSIISINLILKAKLDLSEHLFVFNTVLGGSIILVVFSWVLSLSFFIEEPLIFFPILTSIVTLILYHVQVKDFKKRLVLILSSPIFYYLFFLASLIIAMYFSR